MSVNYVFSDMSYVVINMKIIPKGPLKISQKLKLDHYMIVFIVHVLGGRLNKSWKKILCDYSVC